MNLKIDQNNTAFKNHHQQSNDRQAWWLRLSWSQQIAYINNYDARIYTLIVVFLAILLYAWQPFWPFACILLVLTAFLEKDSPFIRVNLLYLSFIYLFFYLLFSLSQLLPELLIFHKLNDLPNKHILIRIASMRQWQNYFRHILTGLVTIFGLYKAYDLRNWQALMLRPLYNLATAFHLKQLRYHHPNLEAQELKRQQPSSKSRDEDRDEEQ